MWMSEKIISFVGVLLAIDKHLRVNLKANQKTQTINNTLCD